MRKLAGKYAAMGIVVPDTAKAVASKFKTELEAGFSSGQDAYGRAWPNLASGAASHLRQTGKYQASVDALAIPGVTQSLIELTSNNAANLHAKDVRNGRRFQPARPLMPIDGTVLPPKWTEIIGETFASEMGKAAK